MRRSDLAAAPLRSNSALLRFTVIGLAPVYRDACAAGTPAMEHDALASEQAAYREL